MHRLNSTDRYRLATIGLLLVSLIRLGQASDWKTVGLLEVNYKTIDVRVVKYNEPIRVEYGAFPLKDKFPWQAWLENQWHLVNKPEIAFEDWIQLVHPNNITDKDELEKRFNNQKNRYPTPQSVKDDPINTPYAIQYLFGELYYRSDSDSDPTLVIVYLYKDAYDKYKSSPEKAMGFVYQSFKKHDGIWKSVKQSDPIPGIQYPVGGIDFHKDWHASEIAFLATNGRWLALSENNLKELTKSLISDFRKATD